jgi:uncharacterized DUF497 family protein
VFEWDDGNRGEIAAHGILPGECEEAMGDRRRLAREVDNGRGEWRAGMIGSTRAGRLLVVVYTMRADRFRVVTAWPATGRDARAYGGLQA